MKNFYKTKTEEKYVKEIAFPDFENLKNTNDYLFKFSLTKDNKLLFRCYNINSLDFKCYEVIKTTEEIFNTYEKMKELETGSILFNVLENRFRRRRIINYDRETDTISIETNFEDTMLIFELKKRDITCLKEYIRLLCHTIKQLKEDSEFIKEKKEDMVSELVNAKKIPSMLSDIEILKNQIETINKTLFLKENEINILKDKTKEIDKNRDDINKSTKEINKLKEENKSLKQRIAFFQEFIAEIHKIFENSKKNPKMTIPMFNRKYGTNFQHNQIKYINLEGFNIGNIGLKDLCELEFYDLEILNLSSNNLSDITYLENAKYPKLRELFLFFNKIKDINVLEKVNFPSLTKLGLSDNYITDIKVLEKVKFPFLEKLSLSNNRIKDLYVLCNVNFRFLRELKLSKNEIYDISFLKYVNFPSLKILLLSNNNIRNIDILEEVNFPILLELKLSNNEIQDISKLENAKFNRCLKRIFLSNNMIRKIDSLYDYPRLKEVYIYKNYIDWYNIPYTFKKIIIK